MRVGERSPTEIGWLEGGVGGVTPEKCEPAAFCRICFLMVREVKRAALR